MTDMQVYNCASGVARQMTEYTLKQLVALTSVCPAALIHCLVVVMQVHTEALIKTSCETFEVMVMIVSFSSLVVCVSLAAQVRGSRRVHGPK